MLPRSGFSRRASWQLTSGFPFSDPRPSERRGPGVTPDSAHSTGPVETHLRQERYKRLCARCRCHNARELAEGLAAERSPRRCPIARPCGQPGVDIRHSRRAEPAPIAGVDIRLPARLFVGKARRDTSCGRAWSGDLERRRATMTSSDPPPPPLPFSGAGNRAGNRSWLHRRRQPTLVACA